MKKSYNMAYAREKIVYTAIAVILLCAAMASMIGYIYSFAEKEAFENLHLQTQQLQGEINLQMYSDRENLLTMANFASKLHADGEGYELLFQSFEKIGLIENIGLLLPDNTLVTKAGKTQVGSYISFEEEAQKGPYISGRVMDVTLEREIVRSAVPVVADGQTVAILYGIVELQTFEDKFKVHSQAMSAELFVVECETGNYILDTKREELGNITALASVKYKDGFSYGSMVGDIYNGSHGYSSYRSQISDYYYYVHYSPLEFANWVVILAKPEQVVFAGATATGSYLIVMLLIVIAIITLYVLLLFNSERKKLRKNSAGSDIRKNLLEVNQQFDVVTDALENIQRFSKSRSAFFVDTLGEDHCYILPSQRNKLLNGEDKHYFITKVLSYASVRKAAKGESVYVISVKTDKKLKKSIVEFYDFLKQNDIKRIDFSVVARDNNTSVLGVVNARNNAIDALLKDISVCFAMAVYNKKHLDKTEAMALTDSLTGLANRMAYKRDINELAEENRDSVGCIYIDVNGLHYFNNTHGHAAGDQMLVFIANTLKQAFSDGRVYRMGGDEFLVITKDIAQDTIDERLLLVNETIEEMKYHISVGLKFGEDGVSIEETVNVAEQKMREDKARFYHQRGQAGVLNANDRGIEHLSTGIPELDATLSIISNQYRGVYSVSLKNDTVSYIMIPEYLIPLSKSEKSFKKMFSRYVDEMVLPDYHRDLFMFLEYDSLEQQLLEGRIPSVAYTNNNGENLCLSVHLIPGNNDEMKTIWVFETDNIKGKI